MNKNVLGDCLNTASSLLTESFDNLKDIDIPCFFQVLPTHVHCNQSARPSDSRRAMDDNRGIFGFDLVQACLHSLKVGILVTVLGYSKISKRGRL